MPIFEQFIIVKGILDKYLKGRSKIRRNRLSKRTAISATNTPKYFAKPSLANGICHFINRHYLVLMISEQVYKYDCNKG